MNSQALGELASDQKIEKVFHAHGYSIPVGKDGRRLWPRKFKNEVGQRMRTGRLSTRDVAKTCGISSGTASEWKNDAERKASGPHSTLKVNHNLSLQRLRSMRSASPARYLQARSASFRATAPAVSGFYGRAFFARWDDGGGPSAANHVVTFARIKRTISGDGNVLLIGRDLVQ